MLKFYVKSAIALLIAGAAISARALPQAPVNAAIEAICRAGVAEGRYPVQFGKLGRTEIYFVCVSAEQMTATWKMVNPSDGAVTLPYTALDGDQLTFTSFGLDSDDAKGLAANNTPGIRLEVSLSALQHGVLQANYKTMHSRQPVHLSSMREAVFPNLLASADHRRDYLSFVGTFKMELGHLGSVTGTFPFFIDVDVINGIQRVTFADSGQLDFALYDGMKATGAGNAVYAGSGVLSGTGAVMPLLHVRGRLISNDELEFYYFNTLFGMNGPLYAKRM